MSALSLAVFIIVIALAFDFLNGFHDAANSVATVVATRVLTPFQAVLWAAFFNFVSAFTFGTGVAKSVGTGFVDLSFVTPFVIMAGLFGAIAWDLITCVLVASGLQRTFHVPLWVILAAHASIALGTLSGGWRIVNTMGHRLTRLKPRSGFCAETSAAISILLATFLRQPVSTTHVI